MSLEKIARLKQLEEQGYTRSDEAGDLILFNYTDKCTYERFWNEDTLSARGTIYNKVTGEIVARAFDKFFNLGEHGITEEILPKKRFIALEKADGSLGIVYFDTNCNMRVATRGSFKSDQAKWATEFTERTDRLYYSFFKHLLQLGYTPLVEIIYPQNRIIVNYGDKEDLVVLGARNIQDGSYYPFYELQQLCEDYGVSVCKAYSYSLATLKELQKTIDWQNEGWVLTYENGFRVKVKGEDYCRIAKVKSCLSPLSVWEAMVEGKAEQYIAEMSDEIHAEAQQIYDNIKFQHNMLISSFFEVQNALDISSARTDYKEMAQNIREKAPKAYQNILLGVMRGRDSKLPLLELLRPTANKYITALEIFKC